jgi:hypothetical protein
MRSVDTRRLVAAVSGAALIMGSLGAALVAAVATGGFLGSGGNPSYGPLIPLFLVLALSAPFVVAAISSPVDWTGRGLRALLYGVVAMILSFAFGVGGLTAVLGVVLAVAIEYDDDRQLRTRLVLVLAAAVLALPAFLFFYLDGLGYVVVPAVLIVGAIALADRLTTAR